MICALCLGPRNPTAEKLMGYTDQEVEKNFK